MNKTHLYISLIFTLFTLQVFSQDNYELFIQIKNNITELNNNVKFVDKEGQVNIFKIDKFKGLMDSEAGIINFIEPVSQKKTEVLNTKQFISILEEHYPQGYEIKLSNSLSQQNIQPIRVDMHNYKVIVPVDLSFVGIYVHNEKSVVHNISKEVYFVYSYNHAHQNDAELSTIASVQPVFSAYTEQVGEDKYIAKQQEPINNVTAEQKEEQSVISQTKQETQKKSKAKEKSSKESMSNKIEFGLFASGNYGMLTNKNIAEDENFTITPGIGYAFGLILHFPMAQGKMSISTGAGYNTFSSDITESLNNYGINTIRKEDDEADPDGDGYYYYIENNVTENYLLSYIQIPLNFNYYINGINKNGLNLSMGTDISLLMTNKSTLNGETNTQGYYPEYHVVLYDIPSYGFTNEIYNNDEINWEPASINILVGGGIGYNLVMGKSKMSVTAFYKYGISDLGYEDKKYAGDYFDAFGLPGKISISETGIKLEFIF